MENPNEMAAIIGGIVGILAHIPLVIDIIRDEDGYSFASFGLWSLLDFIAARSLFLQNEDYTLALTWGCCAGSMALLLLIKKKVSWSWVESMVLVLVAITLTLWSIFGSKIALIATISSLMIASIPQIKDTFINPSKKVGRVYIIFTLSAVISIFSATEISFTSLVYPVTATMLCGLIMYLSYKKTKYAIHEKN